MCGCVCVGVCARTRTNSDAWGFCACWYIVVLSVCARAFTAWLGVRRAWLRVCWSIIVKVEETNTNVHCVAICSPKLKSLTRAGGGDDPEGGQRAAQVKFSKARSMVTFYNTCTRALTFQNFCELAHLMETIHALRTELQANILTYRRCSKYIRALYCSKYSRPLYYVDKV